MPLLDHSLPPGPSPFAPGRRRCLQTLAAAGTLAASWPAALAQSSSAAAEEARAPAMPALGSSLRVPRIERLDGPVFDPAQAMGKPLLVYWWASTCPFCALQSPAMEQFWRTHRARGLQMLALSIDRRPEDATAYLRAKGYSFPAAWASPAWRQGFPKPRGLPITLLAGSSGQLVLAERGQMFAEDVEEMARFL